jgi:hypothetical protein
MDAEQIRAQRQRVLHELEALEQMRRGSVVEQYREVSRPGVRRRWQGPYPLTPVSASPERQAADWLF